MTKKSAKNAGGSGIPEEEWLWMAFWEGGLADFEEDGSLSSSEASGLTAREMKADESEWGRVSSG